MRELVDEAVKTKIKVGVAIPPPREGKMREWLVSILEKWEVEVEAIEWWKEREEDKGSRTTQYGWRGMRAVRKG